jgi:hypothetical protein
LAIASQTASGDASIATACLSMYGSSLTGPPAR